MTYSELVAALKKPGAAIINDLTPEKADALHMASALMGEAGELFDAVKKWAIYGKPLDRENVIEELGDIEFYLEGLRQVLDVDRGDSVATNMAKLTVRYGTKYSNEAAIARKDK